MNPLLGSLTAITIWSAVSIVVLTIVVRYMWRRGKHVEEP